MITLQIPIVIVERDIERHRIQIFSKQSGKFQKTKKQQKFVGIVGEMNWRDELRLTTEVGLIVVNVVFQLAKCQHNFFFKKKYLFTNLYL